MPLTGSASALPNLAPMDPAESPPAPRPEPRCKEWPDICLATIGMDEPVGSGPRSGPSRACRGPDRCFFGHSPPDDRPSASVGDEAALARVWPGLHVGNVREAQPLESAGEELAIVEEGVAHRQRVLTRPLFVQRCCAAASNDDRSRTVLRADPTSLQVREIVSND